MLLPGGTTRNIPRPPVREGVREQGEIVAWWGDVGDALGKKSGRFALIGTRLAL